MSAIKVRWMSAAGLTFLFGPVALFSHLNGDFLNGGGIPCVFKAVTGYPCPGCGMTRAVAALSHFHFSQSVHFHVIPLLVLSTAVFALIAPTRFISINQRLNAKTQSLSLSQNVTLGMSLLAVAIALNFLRVATGFYPS